MPADPSASGLLDIAQRLLGERIAPQLDAEQRFLALMIASAMRMAARQAEQAGRLAGTEAALLALAGEEVPGEDPDGRARRLVDALRSGRLDPDARTHHALWADAVVRTSVTKPSALSRTERRLAGLPGDEPGA